MKKMIAILLITVLALTGAAALADDYVSDHMTFNYAADGFEITVDERGDDEQLVVLTGKDAAWGVTELRLHLQALGDGETFPTLEEFTATVPDVEVAQVDWSRYRGAFVYALEEGDSSETVIVAPVRDNGVDKYTLTFHIETVVLMSRKDT